MPESRPATTWTRRALRRVAGGLGGAVVLAGVVPALANAAGAHVANPVGIVLRATGFGADAGEPCTAGSPSASPSASPVESVSPEPEASAPEAPKSEAPECDEASAAPSESATPDASDAPESDAPESDAPEPATSADASHGAAVSTVAHCAPHGHDPLLDQPGAPGNHGGYVSVAAHGGTLTTPWGTFDLSTVDGANALCAALTAARTGLPSAAPSDGRGRGHGHGNGHGHGHAKAGKHGGHDDGAGDEQDGGDS